MSFERKDEKALPLSEVLQKVSVQERIDFFNKAFGIVLNQRALQYDEKENIFRGQDRIIILFKGSSHGAMFKSHELLEKERLIRDKIGAGAMVVKSNRREDLISEPDPKMSDRTNFTSFLTITGIKLDDAHQLDQLGKSFELYAKQEGNEKLRELIESLKQSQKLSLTTFIHGVFGKEASVTLTSKTATSEELQRAGFDSASPSASGSTFYEAKQQIVPPKELVEIIHAALKTQPIKAKDGVIECQIKDPAAAAEIYGKMLADINTTFSGIDASGLMKNLTYDNGKITINTENIIKILPKPTHRPEA